MKKVNILFTVWGFSYGGAERFVYNVVRSLDKNRYNVIVFSDNKRRGPMQKSFENCGAKVIYAEAHRFKHPLKFLRQLRKIMLEEKIALIHANDDLNAIFPLIAKPTAVRFIVHSHSTFLRFTQNKILSKMVSKPISKYISKKADTRLSCGVNAGNAMFGKRDFRVINNGIEIKQFDFSQEQREALRGQYGFSNQDVIIGHVGRLVAAKNHDFLIEIARRMVGQNKNYKFMLIGDGELKTKMESKIKNYHLQNNIMLLPPRNDAHSLYNVFDVFVFPSLYEGFPMVLIEAQANGVPIVASTAIPKEVKMNSNFKFMELRAGATAWASEIVEARGQRVLPSKKLQEYSMQKTAERIREIYEEE